MNPPAWTRALRAYREGRLAAALASRLRPWVRGARWMLARPAAPGISLHAPDYVRPDPGERGAVERIFVAFQKMKKDQGHAPACYAPSPLWQAQLEEAFADLVGGLRDNDLERFHFFLANFGAWKTYHGLESSTFVQACARSALKRRYMEQDVFRRQLDIWTWFYNGRKPRTCLSYPTHGNQSGAYVDGVFVGVGSFFNEIYGSLLAGLIADLPRPVVAELGAGYGKLAYFVLRDLPRATFIDFDLPETLCVAAYYLTRAFPHRRSLLYGEGEYGPELHREYDLIFMPGYEISKVGAFTVDLFINKNSLGEMTREAVESYVAWIARATRGHFFHMNHDGRPVPFAQGECGLLGHQYPVPMDQFRLLFRYPDLGHMVYEGALDLRKDIFLYLYERRGPTAAGPGPQAGGDP